MERQAQHDIRLCICDAVVFFPRDFQKQLEAYREGGEAAPVYSVIKDTANALTGQNVATPEEWWKLRNEYNGHMTDLFPKETAAAPDKK